MSTGSPAVRHQRWATDHVQPVHLGDLLTFVPCTCVSSSRNTRIQSILFVCLFSISFLGALQEFWFQDNFLLTRMRGIHALLPEFWPLGVSCDAPVESGGRQARLTFRSFPAPPSPSQPQPAWAPAPLSSGPLGARSSSHACPILSPSGP